MAFGTLPIPTNPWTGFAWPSTGQATNRTGPDRAADWTNLKDFGAIGNGTADDSNAIQAAINALGTIYVPPGTYNINRTITMPSVSGGQTLGGERWKFIGYNAVFQSNFPGFMFDRPHPLNDNYDPKGFQGLVFVQNHQAGGICCFRNSFLASVVDCTGILAGGIGFIFNGGNGSTLIQNCKFYNNGPGANNSVAIGVQSLGGTVIGCDIAPGFDRGVVMNGIAGTIQNCRFEIARMAICVGIMSEFQFINSITDNGSGMSRINLNSNILFDDSPPVAIGDFFYAVGGYPTVNGATVTAVSANPPYLDINLPFQSNSITYWSGKYIVRDQGFQFDNGACCVFGNDFEANGYGVYTYGGPTIAMGNRTQMYLGTGTGATRVESIAGMVIAGGSATVAIGNNFSGQTQQGLVYLNEKDSAAPNTALGSLVQSDFAGYISNHTLVEFCYVTQAYTNSSGPFQCVVLPHWLTNGTLLATSTTYITFPAGTTVTGVNFSNATFSTSNAFSGTLPAGRGFYFVDSGGNPVGLYTLT